ncbi:MAG: MFS transporter [Thermoactinomycetaceae bacterium]|jgi:YQGE family putative transporter|nr:MFS transporter [Bacillota bacterium]MBO2532034.1 MFS transporter [Thermoactinomycetaceae bacterium]
MLTRGEAFMELNEGRRRLDREAWLLLLISGLFAAATALSNTFVNVYLWKINGRFALIGWFNLVSYVAMAAAFVAAGRLAKRVDRVVVVRLGVALQAVFYLSVLILGRESAGHVTLLGAFMGIGAGFFWLAFNLLYFEITERDNRDVFNGVNGLLISAAGIVAPMLSGWIIKRLDQLTGYRIIFSLSLGTFLLAVLISFFLKRRRAAGRFRLADILRLGVRRGSRWHWVSLAMIAQGAREGVFAFLIGLLVYIAAKDEWVLGTFLAVSSLVSLVTYYLAGRLMRPGWRDECILVGALMAGVAGLPILWELNTWTLFILGVGAALFSPLYLVPLTSTAFDVIGESQKTARFRVEFVVCRELFLSAGRVLSLLLFLWWVERAPSPEQLRWLVLAVGFAPVFAWLAIRHVPLPEGKGR